MYVEKIVLHQTCVRQTRNAGANEICDSAEELKSSGVNGRLRSKFAA